jgi:lysyl-tRNA synthetase class 2
LETEDPIRSARLEKLESLRKIGVEPYPHGFAASHTVTEVVQQFGQKTHDELAAEPVTLKVAGRITMMRHFGKAGFLQIFDGRSRFQLYVRREQVSERDFGIYNLLDTGDFVGAEGTLFRTRTGELTLQVKVLFFLSKALLPLPEKWHGLRDTELREPGGAQRVQHAVPHHPGNPEIHGLLGVS